MNWVQLAPAGGLTLHNAFPPLPPGSGPPPQLLRETLPHFFDTIPQSSISPLADVGRAALCPTDSSTQ